MSRRRRRILSISSGNILSGHVISVKTDNAGTSTSVQFTVPTEATGTYDCVVDWGDDSTSTISTYNDAAWTHTYSGTGTYTITITGQFEKWRFNNGGDREKLLEIKNWGSDFRLGNTASFYYGCTNLLITANDTLNLSGTTNLTSIFRACTSLTTIPNIRTWNTSLVTTINTAFFGCTNMNIDFTDFDMSGVTSMASGFSNCSNFEGVGVSRWDMSSMLSISSGFSTCSVLNIDISAWNINSVTNMSNMFINTAFNQTNYDLFLIAQDGNSSLQTGVTAHFGTATYSAGAAADGRTYLTGTKTWSLTDGGAA